MSSKTTSKFGKGRFTRLQLKSWRNFGSVDIALSTRTFVVGANATGKSNFLDVFRFLQDLAADGGGLTNALAGENRGGIKALRSLFSRKYPDISVVVSCEIDDVVWHYQLVLTESKGQALVKNEVVRKGNKEVYSSSELEATDEELHRATALEQPSLNREFRILRDFFLSIEYIPVVPQLIRRPANDNDRFGKGLGASLIAANADNDKTATTFNPVEYIFPAGNHFKTYSLKTSVISVITSSGILSEKSNSPNPT